MADGRLIEMMKTVKTIPIIFTESYNSYCIIETSMASVSFVNLDTIVPFGVISKKLSFVLIIARIMFMCRFLLALMAILTNVYNEKNAKNSVAAEIAT